MSGKIKMRHRFGGHGGKPTEWEIRAFRANAPRGAAIIDGLVGRHPLAQPWSGFGVAGMDLPQGTPRKTAVAICSALRDGNSCRVEALVTALEAHPCP